MRRITLNETAKVAATPSNPTGYVSQGLSASAGAAVWAMRKSPNRIPAPSRLTATKQAFTTAQAAIDRTPGLYALTRWRLSKSGPKRQASGHG